MILSRNNLLIYKLSKQDKAIPVLDNVHFQEDGTSIATNGLAVVSVSSVKGRMRKHVILDDNSTPKNITIAAESVKEALKSLPKDTKFAGVLEHCVLEKKENGKTKFKFSDGKRSKSMEAKEFKNPYTNYQDVFKKAYEGDRNIKTAVNLSRLFSVISIINEVCPDSAHETPVFLEFTKEGNFVFRATNARSGQQVIAVMKAYDGLEGKIPELTQWEKEMFNYDNSGDSDNGRDNNNDGYTDRHSNKINKGTQGNQNQHKKTKKVFREGGKIKKIKKVERTSRRDEPIKSLRDVNLEIKKNMDKEKVMIQKLKKKIRKNRYAAKF